MFSNGYFDPWLNHGTISSYDLGENVTVINIDCKYNILNMFLNDNSFKMVRGFASFSDYFKSADLTAISERDTILLRTAKAMIINLITLWSY